ncbi:MAG: glycosyltransferase [bacterium]
MKVSVMMVTYNHAKYIAQAIDSVLMQETDFPYELVIGEDCSTDGTREIVMDYQRRYPTKIRLLLSEQNLGARANGRRTQRACRGEYRAILEGDDYWTDPHKLQKQVDFLESHPECSMCYHNVEVLYEDGSRATRLRNSPDQKPLFSLEDILVDNPVTTCSVVYRNDLIGELPESYRQLVMGDWPMWVWLARQGQLAYMNDVMACYRVHSRGVFSSKSLTEWLPGRLAAYDVIDRELGFAYHSLVQQGKARWVQMAAQDYLREAVASSDLEEALPAYRSLFGQYKDLDAKLMRQVLGTLYAKFFFHAGRVHDYATVRHCILGLARYQPSRFLNRGVLSISCEALLGTSLVSAIRRAIHWVDV